MAESLFLAAKYGQAVVRKKEDLLYLQSIEYYLMSFVPNDVASVNQKVGLTFRDFIKFLDTQVILKGVINNPGIGHFIVFLTDSFFDDVERVLREKQEASNRKSQLDLKNTDENAAQLAVA